MCCGQKRTALKASGNFNPNVVNLLYRGAASTHVRGAVSGRLYRFSRPNEVQAIDARDAVYIMQTRMFRQVP